MHGNGNSSIFNKFYHEEKGDREYNFVLLVQKKLTTQTLCCLAMAIKSESRRIGALDRALIAEEKKLIDYVYRIKFPDIAAGVVRWY